MPGVTTLQPAQWRNVRPRFGSEILQSPRFSSPAANARIPRASGESLPGAATSERPSFPVTRDSRTWSDAGPRSPQNRDGTAADNLIGNNRDRRDRVDDGKTDPHNRDREGQRRHWHRDWDRTHHHRDWWRNHYTRFVLFCGGYYYWDAGFWFPAYGYDPYFSTYAYDAPIYSYDDLSPEQVMANVQAELSRLGYYQGAIDGTYGPETREALLSYQQASGLQITGILDQATLESLGMY